MIRRRPRNRGFLIQQAMRDSRSWWIQRSGTLYRLIRYMGGGEYLSYDFWPLPVPSGDLCTMMGQARIGLPMLSVDDNMATYAGTWIHGIDSAVTEGYKSRSLTGGSMTSGSNVLNVTGGDFVAGDIGRRVVVIGAGGVRGQLAEQRHRMDVGYARDHRGSRWNHSVQRCRHRLARLLLLLDGGINVDVGQPRRGQSRCPHL